MKRIVCMFMVLMIVMTSIVSANCISADEGIYKKMDYFSEKTWKVSETSSSNSSIGKFYMTPDDTYAVAKGFKISKSGSFEITGQLLLDQTSLDKVKDSEDAIDFMILEKNSNTMIYPNDKSEFLTIKNTKKNRTTINPISISFNAKGNEEIVFLVKKASKKGAPSLMTVFEVKEKDGNAVSRSKEDFSDEQGKKGWNYYYLNNGMFVYPSVNPDMLPKATNGFEEMKYNFENWWYANEEGYQDSESYFGKLMIGTHTTNPNKNYMTARAYVVPEDGVVDFSGTLLLDINEYMKIPENVDTIGFMVIEKRSNTILYPNDANDFLVLKNTAENRQTPNMFSGSFEAKKGDELLFVCKNLTDGLSPSIQTIIDIYMTKDSKKEKVSNSAEDYSTTQGFKNWKYYYCNSLNFGTPKILAKNIFDVADNFDADSSAWTLSKNSITDKALKSFGTSISANFVSTSSRCVSAIGFKSSKSGKTAIKLNVLSVEGSKKFGVAIVNKKTFEFLYPSEKNELREISKPESISININSVSGEEYLIVFVCLEKDSTANINIDLSIDNKNLKNLITKKQGENGVKCYFSDIEKVYSELLNKKNDNSSYISSDDNSPKDVVFEPYLIKNFDDEKWMWCVDDWSNPASNGYMAVLMETANVSTPNYSIVRSYTVQSDSTVSLYGNMNSEDVGDWLGGNPKGKLFDIMIFNDKGQILFPEDRSGFYTFEAGELTANNPILVNVSADMKAGERIYMVSRNRSKVDFMYTYMYFQIFETPIGKSLGTPVSGTSEGFSDCQGDYGWNYYYTTNDSYSFIPASGTITATPFSNATTNEKTSKISDGDATLKNVFPYKNLFYTVSAIDVAMILGLSGYLLYIFKFKKIRA